MTDIFNLRGKVALVTGGNRGIGRAIALAFAEADATVVVAARKLEQLKEVVSRIRENGAEGTYIQCDLRNDDDIIALMAGIEEKYGKLDILVNNSGISPWVTRSEEVTKEMWHDILQVNLLAPFLLCREAGKIMMRHNFGRIINIASIGGIVGLPRQVAYCASKAALIQMTKVLAVEWAEKYDITVNAIAPGYTVTDLTAGMMESEKICNSLLQRNPSNRFASVDEIAGAARYLASEGASYTTGSVITIDGGTLAY